MKHSARTFRQEPRAPLLFPIMPGGARFRSGDHALLILDDKGRIQFCGDPVLLGNDDSTVVIGMPVSLFIPTLSLRERTPGYNLAYVDFWFAGNVWRRHEVRTRQGLTCHLDVTLRAAAREGRHWFIGLIRRHHHPAADSQPLKELFVRHRAPSSAERPWRLQHVHYGSTSPRLPQPGPA